MRKIGSGTIMQEVTPNVINLSSRFDIMDNSSCRFDIMDHGSYFLCFDIGNYIVLIHQIIFRFYLLKYSLFFQVLLY